MIRGAPRWRHQEVVLSIGAWLRAWAQTHDGFTAVGPVGVELDPSNSVRPDVIFVRPERADVIEVDGLHGGPDLVVEVLSPGTRSVDLVEKRAIYERLRVPEYWVVDPEAERVLVFRLEGDRYGSPRLAGAAVLEPRATPGLRGCVAELLGRGEG